MIGANQAVWPQLKANYAPFPSTSACTNLVAGAPVAAARPQQPTTPSIARPGARTTASDIPIGQQASPAVWEHGVKRACWSVMANLNDLTWGRILTCPRGPPPALMQDSANRVRTPHSRYLLVIIQTSI